MKKLQILIPCMVSLLGSHSITKTLPTDLVTKKSRSNAVDNVQEQTAKEIFNLKATLSSLQEQSFIDQFNTLAAAGIAEISLRQIPTIPTSLFHVITNDQIIQFTTTQIPAFTATQIPAFTPSQIAAFTAPSETNFTNQMAAFTAPQIAAMAAEQIAAMSMNQLNIILPKLSIIQVQALTLAQIQALTINALLTQLDNLTEEQVHFITLPQIAALGILPATPPVAGSTVTPPAAIASQISNLAPAQFLSLSSAQIQTMTNQSLSDQISNITTTQIGYLLPAQIAAITTAQINNMTQDQLNALQTILQNATIITTTNNPNLGTQLTAIANAPGKGVPNEKEKKITPVKKDTNPQYMGSSLDKETGLYSVNKATGVAKTNEKASKDLKKIGKKLNVKKW